MAPNVTITAIRNTAAAASEPMSRRAARSCNISKVATRASAGKAAMAAPVSGFF